MLTFRRIALAAFVLGGPTTAWAQDIVQASAGGGHSVVLDSCGGVWTFGSNAFGQLGDGTRLPRLRPVRVIAGGVRAVAATGPSFALLADGTLVSWGPNNFGQLGLGFSSQDVIVPTPVPGLTGVTEVSVGGSHTLALVGGAVYSWGSNNEGQLGIGTLDGSPHTTPLLVPGLPTIVAVGASRNNDSYALDATGHVWAWGRNTVGQVGRGTGGIAQPTAGRVQKSAIAGDYLDGVVALAPANGAAAALRDDGTVWAWGFNSNGQLGNNGTASRAFAAPVTVAGGAPLGGVQTLSGGAFFFAASKTDGTAWGWGQNNNGQLGDGTTLDRLVAVQVAAEGGGFQGGVARVSAGNSHVLALRTDGTLLSWGAKSIGQLGDGSFAPFQVRPVAIGLTGMTQLAAAGAASTAAGVDAFVWGANGFGQLGVGGTDTENKLVPVAAPNLSGATQFSLSGSHVVTRRADGTATSWGLGSNGQLGNGGVLSSFTPVLVALTGVKMVGAAGNRSMALLTDGTVWGWGFNSVGQLGDGTAANRALPVQAMRGPGVPLAEIDSISASGVFSVAVKSDGTVWTWGQNVNGQLGDGTSSTTSPYAVQVMTAAGPLAGVKSVFAGGAHTLALKHDGTVWAWGANNQGQLGDGTLIDRRVAVQVPGLSGILAVSAGGFSMALGDDHTVWTWGLNNQGQLGDGTTTNRNAPVHVLRADGSWLAGLDGIAAGGAHGLARTTDGTVYTWGNNDSGQLGDGESANKVLPGPVTFEFPDRPAPAIAAAATPGVLWPPNHKLVPVSVTVTAGDSCTGTPAVELVSVVNSEGAAASVGSVVRTGNQWSIELRAERDDDGPGRVYTITFSATDAAHTATSADALVAVPHRRPD